jgi:hypothetical protein
MTITVLVDVEQEKLGQVLDLVQRLGAAFKRREIDSIGVVAIEDGGKEERVFDAKTAN